MEAGAGKSGTSHYLAGMKNYILPALALLLTATVAHSQTTPPPPTQAEMRAKAAKEFENAPANTETLDAKNGFRQFKFGTPVSQYPTLRERAKGLYTAPEEPMTVGDVKLRTLLFSTQNGLLSGVNFGTYGEANCQKILEALEAQYGPGKDIAYNKKAWIGNTVTMLYERKTSYGAYSVSIVYADVYISNNAMNDQASAEKKAAAKKAAADL
jgi:hypothetical protein